MEGKEETPRRLLVLRGLRLDSFPSVGDCINELDLNENRLRGLCCPLPKLEVLRLAGNDLEELPESIGDFKSLRVLELGNDISGNFLTRLPASIVNLKQLEVLQVSGNRLVALPSLKLPKLRVLAAARNQLSELPEAMELPCLEVMRLEDNQLRRLPTNVTRWLPRLLLDLSANRIEVLPSWVKRVKRLLLSGNPCLHQTLPVLQIERGIPRLVELCQDALQSQQQQLQCAQCPRRFGCPSARLTLTTTLECHPHVCLVADLCHCCMVRATASNPIIKNSDQIGDIEDL